METAATASAITSTGLRPIDWERLPHAWLVSTTMSAATEMVRPICHSLSPTSRERGAMTGLRVDCPT